MKKQKKSRFAGKVRQDAHRQQQSGSSYGYLLLPKGVNVFSAEPGSRTRLDVLPYAVTSDNHPDRNEKLEIAIPGELWYKRPYKVHRNIGATNETVVCPASFGKRCPICEYRAKRLKEGADKEETDALKTSLRNLYAVIPIGSKQHDEKPHVWDISQFLFQNLLNEELQENEEFEVFPDLEEGLTLRIRFDSKTIGSSKPFAEASRIDFEERDPYDESILKQIPNLDEMLNVLSYQELEKIFLELDETDIAEEPIEEDEKPARRRRRPEPEEDPEPEEEPEEKPVRRRKTIPEPEEEPEPEEKPTRRRKQPEPEPEEEPEEEPEPPARKRQSPKSTNKDERCPHGHRFGVDTDQFDECDRCKIWDDCIEQKEKNE